jgi:hypothetical protein
MMRSLRSAFDGFEADGTVFGSVAGAEFKALPVVVPPRSIIDAYERLVGPSTALQERHASQRRLLQELKHYLAAMLLGCGSEAP